MVFNWLRFWKPKIDVKKDLADIEIGESRNYLLIQEVKYRNRMDTQIDLVLAKFESDGYGGSWITEKNRILSFSKLEFKQFMENFIEKTTNMGLLS